MAFSFSPTSVPNNILCFLEFAACLKMMVSDNTPRIIVTGRFTMGKNHIVQQKQKTHSYICYIKTRSISQNNCFFLSFSAKSIKLFNRIGIHSTDT